MTGSDHANSACGLELKSHYRSGLDELARDFFSPCMAVATSYSRAAGYFSTSALLSWLSGLARVATGDLAIRLVASPHLTEDDRQTIAGIVDPGTRAQYQRVLVDKIIDEIIELARVPGDSSRRARVFGWLVANEKLQIRFAFPRHVEDAGIFHEKFGVFNLPGDELVAFTGSANETLGGHSRNYESIDVYRGWLTGERERAETKREQFEETWSGEADGLEIVPPSLEAIERLVTATKEQQPAKVAPQPADDRWRHQDEAIDAFFASPAGILEMATGTGKTRTAIRILDRLITSGEVSSVIVSMDGVDLLEQWAIELEAWAASAWPNWLLFRQFGDNRDMAEFALDPEMGILVVSRGRLAGLIPKLSTEVTKRTFIIHDEVHGLGTPALVASLGGKHRDFGWKVGLSATPERAYDEAGNVFITEELGPTLYRFPLEKAIARGVLSEFDYRPLDYDLTDGDRERIRQVYSRKAARLREGNPMSQEQLWTELARVYKTAEMKVDVFAQHLREHPELLDRSILFVEQRDYGERILEHIHRRTHRYRTYYADDDREHLLAFADGKIDCLVTCHRISQGIDIRSLKTVVLFASARSKLETIQRIGRCLRSDPSNPGKRALVVDFVRPAGNNGSEPNADQERSAWLTEMAATRRGDAIGA